MAEVLKRRKALSVSPLKASQTIGAALAFPGVGRGWPRAVPDRILRELSGSFMAL